VRLAIAVNPPFFAPGPAIAPAPGLVRRPAEQIDLPLDHRQKRPLRLGLDKLMKNPTELFFPDLWLMLFLFRLSHEWFFPFEGLFILFPPAFGRGGTLHQPSCFNEKKIAAAASRF
jgi:hypothetical protein